MQEAVTEKLFLVWTGSKKSFLKSYLHPPTPPCVPRNMAGRDGSWWRQGNTQEATQLVFLLRIVLLIGLEVR